MLRYLRPKLMHWGARAVRDTSPLPPFHYAFAYITSRKAECYVSH